MRRVAYCYKDFLGYHWKPVTILYQYFRMSSFERSKYYGQCSRQVHFNHDIYQTTYVLSIVGGLQVLISNVVVFMDKVLQ